MVTCPYCDRPFPRWDGLTGLRLLSEHKATCDKKRYLGGDLTMDTADDATTLMKWEK